MQSFDVLPGADRDYAISQIDTMAGYFGPRACITLGLNCEGLTNTREVLLSDNVLNMAPNPTTGTLRLEANFGRTIKEVGGFSMDGRLMDLYQVENPVFKKDDLNLRPGFYIVTARFEDGVVSKKLIVTK